MNSLDGNITGIEVNGNLSLVSVAIGEHLSVSAIVLETPETVSYLQKGKPVRVLFKETEVVIGTADQHAISLQNRFSGKIEKIEKGQLLSKISVLTDVGTLVSIISTRATGQLDLKKGSKVIAMVKLNEIMLSE